MLGPLSSMYFSNETSYLGLVWRQPTCRGCLSAQTSAIDGRTCQTGEFPGKSQAPFAIEPISGMILVTDYETVGQCGPSRPD